MRDVLTLARSDLLKLEPYQSARKANSEDDIILNANESPWAPYGPAKQVAGLNRYSESQPQKLIKALSDLYGTFTYNMMVTRGSDEGIDLLMRAFCRASKDSIIICPPTYGMYETAARVQGAKVVKVPLKKDEDFALDEAAVLDAWKVRTKLIFLCNPNNPTGNRFDHGAILRLCRKLEGKAIVVVDEAYVEFTRRSSFVTYISEVDNLVVLRTLSKAYGLAGVRCGVLFGVPRVVNLLKQIIAPYPLCSLAIDAVERAISPRGLKHYQQRIEIIRAEREWLSKRLARSPWIVKVWPSEANFILVESVDARAMINHCMEHGILIRDRSEELLLENCVRISVGTEAENQKLGKVLSTRP